MGEGMLRESSMCKGSKAERNTVNAEKGTGIPEEPTKHRPDHQGFAGRRRVLLWKRAWGVLEQK